MRSYFFLFLCFLLIPVEIWTFPSTVIHLLFAHHTLNILFPFQFRCIALCLTFFCDHFKHHFYGFYSFHLKNIQFFLYCTTAGFGFLSLFFTLFSFFTLLILADISSISFIVFYVTSFDLFEVFILSCLRFHLHTLYYLNWKNRCWYLFSVNMIQSSFFNVKDLSFAKNWFSY